MAATDAHNLLITPMMIDHSGRMDRCPHHANLVAIYGWSDSATGTISDPFDRRGRTRRNAARHGFSDQLRGSL
jgi:hypothetical protein